MHIDSLDTIDNKIINLLLEDARMGYSEIGERVGLSRTAVKTRIAALERQPWYRQLCSSQVRPTNSVVKLRFSVLQCKFSS